MYKIGLPGKLIFRYYFPKNMTSRRPFLLLRISFPGRPIFIQLPSESKPATFNDCDGEKPEFNRKDALAVLKDLSLNYATLGDYLVVMNGKVDAVICGEPYLALQLWFHMVSGKFISRIWSQTVGHSRVVNMTQFTEVCTGMNCINISLQGKLIIGERKGLWEVLFS